MRRQRDVGSAAEDSHKKPPLIFTPEYYERMRGLEAQGWWNAGMRDIAARMLGRLPPATAGFGLDVGCGSGQTMRWLRSLLPGWRIQGFDLAREGVRAASASEGGVVCIASALALPYAAACADLVVTLDVLQHLPLGGGDLAALKEMRRVLRPRGHLLVRTNAQAFPRVADDLTYSFHKYRPAELRAKLQEAGFRVLHLGRVNGLLGLAEIPRELRARRRNGAGYHGILAKPRSGSSWTGRLKRRWLGFEGGLMTAGWPLPFGRSLLALAVAQ